MNNFLPEVMFFQVFFSFSLLTLALATVLFNILVKSGIRINVPTRTYIYDCVVLRYFYFVDVKYEFNAFCEINFPCCSKIYHIPYRLEFCLYEQEVF